MLHIIALIVKATLAYNLPMRAIPENIYLSEQVRELDRIAIEELKIAGFTLMQRAGAAVFELIRQDWPGIQRIVVLAGAGNNGGDGYVVADLARCADMQVIVVQVGDHTRLRGDARQAHDVYVEKGGECSVFNGQSLPHGDLVVDALLGTGLTRAVKGELDVVIQSVNQHPAPVLSVDVPSGLDANHGYPLGNAVVAHATVTFVGMKLGLLTGEGRRYAGDIHFSDLQIPDTVHSSVSPTCRSIDLTQLYSSLRERRADAHKGDFGHALIIGGNKGMAGSVMLAATAAARTGCGLVSVATRPQHAGIAMSSCREVMVHGIDNPQDLGELLIRATVVAVGPGLGQDRWAKDLFARVLELDLPLVLDADALNLLAAEPLSGQSWVLTPHVGEAARLLKMAAHEIQHQRLKSVQAIQQQFGGVCVLKGSGTLVASGQQVSICTAGNPGMASGGMGDVLTGVITSLIAQGLNAYDGARFGVQLHAQSADLASRDGVRGMLASDLFMPLRKLVNVPCDY